MQFKHKFDPFILIVVVLTLLFCARPVRASGVSSISKYNPSSVTITGGTITGVTMSGVAIAPTDGGMPRGAIIDFAGPTCPSSYLGLGTTPATASRTTYAALFAAIGVSWGLGDGSTTFGLPYIPAGYTFANIGLGATTVGQVISHTHGGTLSQTAYTDYSSSVTPGALAGAIGLTGAATILTNIPINNTGGPFNEAAAMGTLKCLKF